MRYQHGFSVSHAEKGCHTYQGKDHKLLAYVHPLDNVYIDNLCQNIDYEAWVITTCPLGTKINFHIIFLTHILLYL